MPAERWLIPWLLLLALTTAGCWSGNTNEVVVYSALDQPFSEPVLKEFEASHGISVQPVFDTEAQKTVGLTNRLLAEGENPLCDVFWNNEILNTLRLERAGLLEPLSPKAAEHIPPHFRSPSGAWFGLAARARVLIVNTELLGDESPPQSIRDLANPKYRGRAAIAKPLFGTTATHAAVLFSEWGEEEAQTFLLAVNANAEVLAGNKQVAAAVGGGQYLFGLTDTDDAIIELDNGMPVRIVFPDQAAGEPGTLLIPNTVCRLKGSPHPEAAEKLVEYLLSPAVEETLAAARSAQFPLGSRAKARSRAQPEEEVRWMEVDFPRAAAAWDSAAEFLRGEFAAAD